MEGKTTIARPYAQAIFEVACADGKVTEWLEMLRLLETILTDKNMQRVIVDPKFSATILADVVLDICGKKISKKMQNLVKILANAKRFSFISEICTLYDQLRTTSEGIVKINIASAYDLSPKQKIGIVEMMSKRTGSKMEIDNCIIDDSLIGGVVIRTGDKVIDASIKGRLQAMSNTVG